MSVIGEETLSALLRFLERYTPDQVARAVTWLAANDEAEHVAFGVAHLREPAKRDPALLDRLAQSVDRRQDASRQTAGLNREVYDALELIAAGSWSVGSWSAVSRIHGDLQEGSRRVTQLLQVMDAGRRRHLTRLGFPEEQAALSGLHTHNFM